MAVEFHVDYDKLTAECVSDKLILPYYITKDIGGFAFFRFRVGKGDVPKELSGRYSSLQTAMNAFEQYETKIQKSKSLKRQEFAEAREKRIAESNTESS